MTTDRPLVSVVTIFLNGERFIQEAIESVLAQGYASWELLLVDDGSSDGSTGIARRYAGEHPGRIRYLEHDNHVNRGMSASRNLGIRNARGEYLALLDSDDVWLPQKLERQVAILERHPSAIMVYGATQYWHGWTGQPEAVAQDHIPDLGVLADRLYEPPSLTTALYPLGTGTAPCPSDLLLRRAAVELTGGFEECFTGLYEDQAFLAKVYLSGPVFVSSECWDRYRIHPESCMSSMRRTGDYSAVRQFFLHWLQMYLRRRTISDAAVWTALRGALGKAGAAEPLGRERAWTLRTAGGSSAELVFPSGEPAMVRVAIRNATTGTSFDIQLNQPRYELKAQQRYSIRFRARADLPRAMCAGVAEAHAPWAGLGWYRQVALTPEWQGFEGEFTAPGDETNARIHFDLGESSVPVDIADVVLRHLPDGTPVEPGLGDAGATTPLGMLRRLTPISRQWGFDRGTPIDRYYIEAFLTREAAAIRGRVLEIEDNTYTLRFGGDRVVRSDVLHVVEGNPKATLIADLTSADQLDSDAFDCIVLTQTLHFIYDTRAALRTLHRILKPGGVLLATFPGLSRVSHEEWAGSWYWGFTSASARRLLAEAFPAEAVDVRAFGNVLTSVAFLHGLAAEELEPEELEYRDVDYELLLTVRAVKPDLRDTTRASGPR
jgi:glycosyltransferase involved in cell wall biosynthesis/SAM-dependent methyltransferase